VGLTIDIERWPQVMPTVTRVDRLDDGPIAVGSSARLEQPGLRPAVWTVTTLEPGRRFAWASRLLGARIVGRHDVEAVDGGARNTLTLELDGIRGRVIGTVFGNRLYATLAMENESIRKAALAA
jgi:uncharacterized membrane protein